MNQRDAEISRGETGSGTTGHSAVSRSVSETAGELKDSAREMKDQAVDKAKSMFSGQKDQAVGELSAVAEALRRTGSELQSSDHETVGRITRQAASKIDSFVRSIEDKEPDQIIADVKRIARNNPAAFIGGAVALGFIAARFLKSTGHDDDQYYGGGNSRYYSGSPRGFNYEGSRGLAYAEGYGYGSGSERGTGSGYAGTGTERFGGSETTGSARTDFATDAGIGLGTSRSGSGSGTTGGNSGRNQR